MRLLEVYSPSRGRYISAYTDLVVYDRNRTLYLASISGPETSVDELQSAIANNISLQVSASNGYFADGSQKFRREARLHPFGRYETIKGSIDDLRHYIVHVEHSYLLQSSVNRHAPIYAWDGNIEQVLFDYLDKNFPLPLLPEWKTWIYNELRAMGYVIPLYVEAYGRETNLAAIGIRLTQDDFEQTISAGLRSKAISFQDGDEIDSNLSYINNLSSYLRAYSGLLGEKITEKFAPRHDPRTDALDPMIRRLRRRPFRAQADVIQGSVNALDYEPASIIVGEMGTGKTLIGSSIPFVREQGRPYRTLVMCPGHLLDKWEREIKKTIPGAKVIQINNYKDVLALRNAPKEPSEIEYYIIGRDISKLGYSERAAVQFRSRRGYVCPRCGQTQLNPRRWNRNSRELMLAEDYNNKNSYNTHCMATVREWNEEEKKWVEKTCGEYLWTADNSEGKIRRYPPAKLINRYLKGFFDYFIADEVHELKNSTKQGESLALLAGAAKKTIALTGTLLGGYARDLFYILFRLDPEAMAKEGLSYNHINDWNDRYGVTERDFETEYYGMRSTVRRRRQVRTRVRPGVNPVVFGKHLLNITSFIELSDLQQELPQYNEHVELIRMDEDQIEAYRAMQTRLVPSITSSLRGSVRSHALRRHIHSLMVYPDKPFGWEPILNDDEEVIFEPTNLSEQRIFPKERRLIEIIREEKEQGRKSMVFATFTGKYGMLERLQFVLENAGFRTAILDNVPPKKREAWIKKQQKNVDVILCNPRRVETGLDLIEFPTLIHYQTGYVLTTLRQSSRRSWRIGQTQPVRVYFLAYDQTIQDTSLRLLGDRLEASMALEGRFSEEGLQSLSDGLDMVNELAKAVVDGLSDVDSAEAIWSRMSERQNSFRNTVIVDNDDYNRFFEEDDDIEDAVIIEETGAVEDIVIVSTQGLSLLEFVRENNIKTKSRRAKKKHPENQLDLFSLIS